MFGMRSALAKRGSLLLTISTLSMAASQAQALDRHVDIVNSTNDTIERFYASNVDEDDWEEDILGDDILGPGRAVTVNFDDDSGYCMFDFKAVFSDGDVLVRRRVNVCEISSYTYRP